MKFDPDTMLARYRELEAGVKAVNAENAPAEEELARVNAQINALQTTALSIAASIDARRGGAAWIARKREMGIIARALGKIPHLPTADAPAV